MKKIIVITAILVSLTSASAFAKTEGNYLGVDFINTRTELNSITLSDGTKYKYNNEGYDNSNQPSLGINYKYAANANNFFVAPELFAEYSNATAKTTDGDEYDLKYRYGARLNLGYDFVDQLAAYLILGAANNQYTVDAKSIGSKKSAADLSFLYGAGFKISVAKNIDLNFAYEVSEVDMKTPYSDTWNFDLKVLRIGASYKF